MSRATSNDSLNSKPAFRVTSVGTLPLDASKRSTRRGDAGDARIGVGEIWRLSVAPRRAITLNRVRGHGLGCGSFAPGSLEDGNQTKLEEGMTFIIHPNQYLPETGYLTLGDTVVMTKAKAESLMKSSWDIYVKE